MKQVILTAIFLLLSINIVHANTLVYENNFDQYDVGVTPDDWQVVRNSCISNNLPNPWTVENILGSKMLGIVVTGSNCVTEIIPSNFVIPDLANYEYEVDVAMLDSVNVDRNVAFKYADSSHWYDLQLYHPLRMHYQKIVAGYYPLANIILTDPLKANNVYTFNFKVLDNYIVTSINGLVVNSVYDTEPYMNEGTIALQASRGVLASNRTYFDNIKVFDYSPPPTPTPTPQHLPVEYISQREYPESSYDSIDKTIEQVGCALTAATMVLRYHGFESMIDGMTDLNPETLDDWLVHNKGYNKQGGINFQAVAKLTKLISVVNNVGFDALDFKHLANAQTGLVEELLTQDRNPVIIDHEASDSTSGKHFAVARGVSDPGKAFVVHDPYFATKTEFMLADESVNSYRYFKPSNTDLSYISIEAPQFLSLNMSDPYGNGLNLTDQTIPDSVFELEQPIFDNLLETTSGNPYWKAEVFDPISGNYVVSLTSDSTGMYPIEIWAYGVDGTDQYVYQEVFVAAGEPTLLQLTYDRDSISSSAVLAYSSTYSYNQFIAMLDWLTEQGMVDSARSYPVLANLARVAHEANKHAWQLEQVVMNNFVKHLSKHVAKGWVTEEASELLYKHLP